MIPFDPNDPFPLLNDQQQDYAEEQIHSLKVDQWLGIDSESTEKNLAKHTDYSLTRDSRGVLQQSWIGLNPSALLTPYSELRRILTELNPKEGDRIIDLGAAYGRMAFVIAKHFPEVEFTGYELIAERVRVGQKAFLNYGIKPEALHLQDITDPNFFLIPAPYYFIYDFGSRDAIEILLQKLQSIAKQQSITIVGRGRATRDAIEKSHPWLSQINSPEHFGRFSIYRS